MAYNEPIAVETLADPAENCKAIYDRLCVDREPFLCRARLSAKLTIPWLVPDTGHNSSTDLPSPFQSVGARGVNNLTSKLLLALFPPNAPFFKYEVDPYALEQIEGAKGARTEIEKNLLQASEAILTELATSGFRVGAYEIARHLVVAGNALQYFHKTGVKVYHLDQYVVERDPETGDPVRIVMKEMLPDEDVPASIRYTVQAKDSQRPGSIVKTHELYTCCWLDSGPDPLKPTKGTWRVYQECDGERVPDADADYTLETFPYQALRGNVISGENYGRGYVEEYIGDLLSLEGLSQAIVEGSAQAARVTRLVNPAGMTDIDDLSGAENGQYVPGRVEDVGSEQLGKHFDFQITGNTATAIEQRLSFAFLLNSAVQRNAERVTAEEIRFIAEELEQALGGIYSLLSREWQLPLVKFLQHRMTSQRRLPHIPEKYIHATVVTGIEALGRGNDLNRLAMASNAMGMIATVPPQMLALINPREWLTRIINAAGVRAADLIKTEEQVAQEQQAAQQAQMVSELGPNMVNQVGGMIQQQQAAAAPAQQ